MTERKESSVDIIDRDLKNEDLSPLFPYSFIFRSRDELNEHITNKLTCNGVFYYTKVVLGIFTLILPLFNVFSVYRAMIYQREDFADLYSVFHSLIFYGEFALVHFLVLGTLILFIIHHIKSKTGLFSSRGDWVNLLDAQFTLMAFNLIKLIPILAVNGFNFLSTQISVTAPIFLRYSRSSQVVAFTVLAIAVSFQAIVLVGLLILINLVKVYQVSFVGEIKDPLLWTVNQWLLFIGFAANIINITDIPTVSQLSFMWDITNKYWSHDVDLWLHDPLASKRKVYIYDQIARHIGFVKTFFWVRTMSAIDLHALVRLPPPDERQSENL
jgi:hypothetical protein